MQIFEISELLECDEQPFMAGIVTAHSVDGGRIGPETTAGVQRLRSELIALNAGTDRLSGIRLAKMNDYFAERDAEAYQADHPEGGGPVPGAKLDVFLRGANRAEWVQFADWYQSRISDLLDALRINETVLNDASLTMTETMIDQGVYPKLARPLIEQVIDWAGPLRPIGSIESALRPMNAVCDSDGIGVANLFNLPYEPMVVGSRLKEAIHHEHLHGVALTGEGKRGLFDGFFHEDHTEPNRWLEEAFTSLAARQALSLRAGAPDLRLPAMPYANEARFLEVVQKAAPYPIEMSDLAAAHFSLRRANNTARKHVANGLASALHRLFPEFGPEAYQEINYLYNQERGPELAGDYLGNLALVADARLRGTAAQILQ